jgi:hypothetical protein
MSCETEKGGVYTLVSGIVRAQKETSPYGDQLGRFLPEDEHSVPYPKACVANKTGRSMLSGKITISAYGSDILVGLLGLLKPEFLHNIV